MDNILNKIIKNLQKIDPRKVFLFGSYANGSFHEESDIDLVVILDTDIVPATYDQKLDLKVQVRESIYELSRDVDIDLVVYTHGEFEILRQKGTSFYNEIITNGKMLYEKAV